MARERRNQVNIRLSDEEAERLAAVAERVREATRLQLRQADVFRVGLEELERRYPREENQPQKPVRKPRKGIDS